MDDVGLTTATSQDGKYIVVGSMDDHVYLFQSNSSTPIWKYDTGKNVNSVAISADGWSIVAGSDSNDILFWHRDSSTPVWEYDTDSDVLFVDITADGNYIVAANEAESIPPLKNAPNGTSLIIRNCTDCLIRLSNLSI